VAAVIIVLAGIGVGLFFGLRGAEAETASTTTPTIVASSTTTAAPSTTTTTEPPTTTTAEPTTTTEATTTTTEDVAAVLTQRSAEWLDLLESIPATGQDKTAEIEAYLTPKELAQERAAAYQENWSSPPEDWEIITADPWDAILKVMVEPDGSGAVVISSLKLECRDGLTTRGLVAVPWKKEGGEWLHPVQFEPLNPVEGDVAPFGGAVRVGDLLWSPDLVQELKHLEAGAGPTAPGMFLVVEFFVRNDGQSPAVPADLEVYAVDPGGTEYVLSEAADKWWPDDVKERARELASGDFTYLWYTFDIPEGADVQSFQFYFRPTV
jgi:hypothetical protein